jgi:hypothetical protein
MSPTTSGTRKRSVVPPVAGSTKRPGVTAATVAKILKTLDKATGSDVVRGLVAAQVGPSLAAQMALAHDEEAVDDALSGLSGAAEEMLYARRDRQAYIEKQALTGKRMYPRKDDSYPVEYHPDWWPRWLPRFEKARLELEQATAAVGQGSAVAGARALGKVAGAARARVLALNTPELIVLEDATPIDRSGGEIAARDDIATWHAALRTIVPRALTLDDEQVSLRRREIKAAYATGE